MASLWSRRALSRPARTTSVAALLGGLALERHAVRDVPVGVVRVEVDGALQTVPEAVDVGGVGVDVLAQGVRVLDDEAERLGVVGRDERARGGERRREILARRQARRVLDLRTDDDRLEDGLQPLVRGAGVRLVRHRAAST